jgi:hypothetical protein
VAKLRQVHLELYKAGKNPFLEGMTGMPVASCIPGGKNRRWASLTRMVHDAAGVYGRILFRQTTGRSFKGITQSAYNLLQVDIFKNEQLFQNEVGVGYFFN